MDYVSAMQAVSNPRLVARITSMRTPVNRWERLVWADGPCATNARMTILEALGRLPEVSSAVLVARFGEELTLKEYAQRIERSRERVRQLEAKALRQLRGLVRTEVTELRKAIRVRPVPMGPFDPNWLDTKQAAQITGLTRDHIRYLCREHKVISKRYRHNDTLLAIQRRSLKAYVLATAPRGRRRGIWKGE